MSRFMGGTSIFIPPTVIEMAVSTTTLSDPTSRSVVFKVDSFDIPETSETVFIVTQVPALNFYQFANSGLSIVSSARTIAAGMTTKAANIAIRATRIAVLHETCVK